MRFGILSVDNQHHFDLHLDACAISSKYIGPTPIFEDGFESGDFRKWNGAYVDGGRPPTIVSAKPFRGRYNAIFQTPGETNIEWSASFFTIPIETNEIYARGYFYISKGLPLEEDNDRFALLTVYDPTSELVQGIVRIIKVDGIEKFQLNLASGASYSSIETDAIYPQENMWYCI